MFIDNENQSMRLKIVEDRISFIENLTQLQDKRINELIKQVDHVIHQFQNINLDRCRNEDIMQIKYLEKTIQQIQRELNTLANHQDERINQLISQLVEPSFKDIDYQIKQESQRLQIQCQRQMDDMYEEIINKFKTPIQNYEYIDDTKKKIDDEINRRIQDENEKRRSFLESETKQNKQLSTEKSRAREIQNRLNLERKAKQDKINQLNELYQFRKH